MAIAFGAAGALAQATTGNLTVTPPSISDNDILVAVLFCEADVSYFSLTGWTSLIEFANVTAAFSTTVLWRRASSESGNYVFVHSGSVSKAGFVFTVTGAVTSGSPFSGTPTSKSIGSGTAITNTDMTPADAYNLVVALAVNDVDGTTASWAGGSLTWNERADYTTTGSIYMSVAMATAPQTVPATLSPTATAPSGIHNAHTFALKPIKSAALTGTATESITEADIV